MGEVHPSAGVGVNASGFVGEFAQGRAVEFGENHGAAFILHEGAAAVGDHGTLVGADAEAENADAFGFEFGDLVMPVVGVGFAVAEDDEKTVGRSRRAKSRERGFEQGLVVGAAFGEEVGTKLGEKLAEDLVIGAERTLQNRGAGENFQADAFAFELFEKAGDEKA